MKLQDLITEEFEYHHKGFKLEVEKDREEDNIKMFHYLITPEGKRVHINASPYVDISKEQFTRVVDVYIKTGKVPTEKVNK